MWNIKFFKPKINLLKKEPDSINLWSLSHNKADIDCLLKHLTITKIRVCLNTNKKYRDTGVGTKISTNFFENIDKFFWKYRQIFLKISTKFSKNIDKIFKKYRQFF